MTEPCRRELTARRGRLEAATVVTVAVEDLLTLSGVHASGIGVAAERALGRAGRISSNGGVRRRRSEGAAGVIRPALMSSA